MENFLGGVLTLGPFHLFSFGTLLGLELWQSFVMVKLAYRHLPMSIFTQFQKHVFPVYFSAQTALTFATIATYPPLSVYSIFKQGAVWSVAVPLGIKAAMALLNGMVWGPRVTSAMMARVHQETKEGGRKTDGTVSEEMHKCNRAFSRAHAMSIHLNLIAMLGTAWYGLTLASKLKFDS